MAHIARLRGASTSDHRNNFDRFQANNVHIVKLYSQYVSPLLVFAILRDAFSADTSANILLMREEGHNTYAS